MKVLFSLLATVFLLNACIPTEEILPSGVTESENNNFISFEPTTAATTGFIFYQGAGVAAESYSSWLEQLAIEGYLAIVAKQPLNLAVLDIEAAVRIQNQFPDIDNWIIGGHSLGGAMAIELINKPLLGAARFDGMVLLAAFSSATTDISDWDGKVLSIAASNDLISDASEIEAGKARLPEGIDIDDLNEITNTVGSLFYVIEGGNHAQFGNYGNQQGDGVATISAEAQQTEIVDFTTQFFEVNGW